MKSVRYGSPAAGMCFVSRRCGVHEYSGAQARGNKHFMVYESKHGDPGR